jgi:hypothetical protein
MKPNLKKTSWIAGATALLGVATASLLPHETHAADAKLKYVRASVTRNPWGNFPGIPGGSSYANDPACQALGGSNGLRLTQDIARRHQGTKRKLETLFSNDYMKAVMDRVVHARKLAYPGISEEDSRTIHILIHDCTFDQLGVGPAVLPLKGNIEGPHLEGKDVQWVLLLNDASFGRIEQLVGDAGIASRVADDVIAHELTHGITADLLNKETIKASNSQKNSQAHHAEILSDVSVAFWEGWAEAVEASMGATVRGAFHPFSLDGLGKYVFVFERQQAVRDNLYVYNNALFSEATLPRTHRTGAELMTAEGFIATVMYRVMNELPYRLPSGVVSHGWPFQAVSALIHRAQPTNTLELIEALAADPVGGAAFTADFIRLSSGVTVQESNFRLANLLILLKDHREGLREKLRRNPGDSAAAAELPQAELSLQSTESLLAHEVATLTEKVRTGNLRILSAVRGR